MADAAVVCPPPQPGLDMIDDMNDGDRFILLGKGRSGAWEITATATPGSSMTPAPGGDFTMTDTGDPCRKFAVYLQGSGFALGDVTLSVGLGSPYDASAYHSLTFWAKVDPGPGIISRLRVAFPDKDTSPNSGTCQMPDGGAGSCWNHYGAWQTFTTEWAQYTVPFSSLTPRWGESGGTGFDPASVYGVEFEIPVNAIFGLWIDDIGFLP